MGWLYPLYFGLICCEVILEVDQFNKLDRCTGELRTKSPLFVGFTTCSLCSGEKRPGDYWMGTWMYSRAVLWPEIEPCSFVQRKAQSLLTKTLVVFYMCVKWVVRDRKNLNLLRSYTTYFGRWIPASRMDLLPTCWGYHTIWFHISEDF